MNKQIVKSSLYLISITLIAVLLIWVGIMTIKENYSRDINHVTILEGTIEKTETILKPKKVRVYPSSNLNLMIFKIKINNSTERLYYYKASQEYYDLTKKLKKGMKVTIYYKELRESQVINNIFRLDTEKGVILTHKDYKEKEYFAGIVMILLGLFFIIFSVITLKIKGLHKFLD